MPTPFFGTKRAEISSVGAAAGRDDVRDPMVNVSGTNRFTLREPRTCSLLITTGETQAEVSSVHEDPPLLGSPPGRLPLRRRLGRPAGSAPGGRPLPRERLRGRGGAGKG